MAEAPTQADEKDPNYYPYHRKKGHALGRCVMFKRIFDKNYKPKKLYSRTKVLAMSMSDSFLTTITLEAMQCPPQKKAQGKHPYTI